MKRKNENDNVFLIVKFRKNETTTNLEINISSRVEKYQEAF